MAAAPTKTAPANSGPIVFTETVAPTEQAEVAAWLRSAYADETPIYPLGGKTALGCGLASKQAGLGLSTKNLSRVIDYPARDMTITVEAGITLAQLAETLAAENQFLPVDVAQPQSATLGGAMAVNMSGPRRLGYGTLRDYVIGVSAVDGTGTPFKAGGRVVKNVAGYDFCKLLTGSLGTLAVITQITLKVRPRPTGCATVVYGATDFDQADRLLSTLTTTATTPVAVELLGGAAWRTSPLLDVHDAAPVAIVIGFEGTTTEVDWQLTQLDQEWKSLGGKKLGTLVNSEAMTTWQRLTEFGCANPSSLILKLTARPSRICELSRHVESLIPQATTLAHAGNGVMLIDCGDLASADAVKLLLRDLRPLAAQADGHVTVWNAASPDEWTRAAFWGPTRDDAPVMRIVKNQFDPKGLLNPGRFIF